MQSFITKNTFFLFLFIISLNTLQAQGIQFEKESSWEDILKKANTNNQWVFVDFYTNWCSPCKKMDKEVFTQKEVGTFFNKNFINTKINAEKGIGKKLKRKYKVKVFPSFVFVNGDGDLMYKTTSYKNAEALLEEGKKAIDKTAIERLQTLEKQFKEGERKPQLLKEYLILRQARYQINDANLVKSYLTSLSETERKSAENEEIIFGNLTRVDSPFFDWALAFVEPLPSNYGSLPEEERIAIAKKHATIGRAVKRTFKIAMKEEKEELLYILLEKNVIFHEQKAPLTKSQDKNFLIVGKENLQFQMDFYKKTNQEAKYVQIVEEYINENILKEKSVAEIKEQDAAVKKYTERADVQEKQKERQKKRLEQITKNFKDKLTAKQFKKLTETVKNMGSKNLGAFKAENIVKIVTHYLTFVQEKTNLAKAENWLKDALELQPTTYTYIAYGHLFQKMGQVNNAKDILQKGLNWAKEAKQDTTELEESLENFN